MGSPAPRRKIGKKGSRGNIPRRGTPEAKVKDSKKTRLIIHDIFGGVFLLGGIYTIVACALVTIDPLSGSKNFLGELGFSFGTALLQGIGITSYVAGLFFLFLGIQYWRNPKSDISRISRISSFILSLLSLSVIFGLLNRGGRFGNGLESFSVTRIGSAGTLLLFGALAFWGTLFWTQLSFQSTVKGTSSGVTSIFSTLGRFISWFSKETYTAITTLLHLERKSSGGKVLDKTLDVMEMVPKPRRRKENDTPSLADAIDKTIETPPTHIVVKRPPPVSTKTQAVRSIKKADGAVYKLPPLNILSASEEGHISESESELMEISKIIEAKLRDFSISGRVTEVHPGPVVTMFEFEPAAGVKVGRIAALQDDLAMSLRAVSLRIVAPIPKKGTVGIEVPNKTRDIVRLRTLLESESMRNQSSVLTIGLGKDAYGEPVCADVTTMPHLLIAGATGTGKSVCINTVLLSLLYRATPKELGLILIDPKILELSVYDGIPHLKVPVVTVPKQARAVLDWAAREMDRRYRLMQRFGVRNIDGYNKLVEGKKDFDGTEDDDAVVTLSPEDVIAEGTADPSDQPNEALFQEKLEPLSKIVIVIDELADLMLTVGRDIEELITRLAQKARAAGIHLIVATQRPSVDVITGLIKANFPARLSFRVASRIDSRTILDNMGAEKLLGRGDMLFLQPGGGAPRRLHGAFVSDAEVKAVIEAVKQNGPPTYDERIMAICAKALEEDQPGGNGGSSDPSEYDSVYEKAIELVLQKGQASTSMLQRAFRIGYNRAARIIELMEKEGIVGPMDGVKPREVLADARLKVPMLGVVNSSDDELF